MEWRELLSRAEMAGLLEFLSYRIRDLSRTILVDRVAIWWIGILHISRSVASFVQWVLFNSAQCVVLSHCVVFSMEENKFSESRFYLKGFFGK